MPERGSSRVFGSAFLFIFKLNYNVSNNSSIHCMLHRRRNLASYVLFKYGLKAKYDNVLKEAETEAEVIKKNKLLEVKKSFSTRKQTWRKR